MKKAFLWIALILWISMPALISHAESKPEDQKNTSEHLQSAVLPANQYAPLSIIVDEDSVGYIYDDMDFSRQNDPPYYWHSTSIRKWDAKSGEGAKIEMNIQIAMDTRIAPESKQITGWNIYSDDRFLFSLSLYNEIPSRDLPKLDRVFVAVLEGFKEKTNCLICVPCYNNEYEAIDESYMITPGDDVYFFEGR